VQDMLDLEAAGEFAQGELEAGWRDLLHSDTMLMEQAHQAAAFCRSAAQGRPIILAGDFNGGPDAPHMTLMESFGYMNAWQGAVTWDCNNPNIALQRCESTEYREEGAVEAALMKATYSRNNQFDHVLYHPGCANSKVVLQPHTRKVVMKELPVSDHYGLLVDFEVQPKGNAGNQDETVKTARLQASEQINGNTIARLHLIIIEKLQEVFIGQPPCQQREQES